MAHITDRRCETPDGRPVAKGRRGGVPFAQGFAGDRKGTVAIVFALAVPVVVAAAGYGVETAYWHYEKLRVQEMADVAAHAGAIERRAGKSYAEMYAAAVAAAVQNGYRVSDGEGEAGAEVDDLDLNETPTSGAFAGGNAVEVFVHRKLPRFFSGLFTESEMWVQARSVSRFGTAGNACVLALHPNVARAADFSGSSSVTFEGCNVMANSTAADSVYVNGAGSLRTPCIMTAGGVTLNAGATLTTCAAPMTGLPPVADPFKDVPEPVPNEPCRPASHFGLTNGGHFCSNINISGTVSLPPGVYTFDGATLKVNGGANVSSQSGGVVFHFMNGGTMDFNGNATMNIAAPTSGPYSGMLMFGGRDNAAAGEVKINGTASSKMTGAMYFPKNHLQYQGNFSGNNGCTQVVASSITWTGNTTVNVDCTDAGMPPISIASVVKLAE